VCASSPKLVQVRGIKDHHRMVVMTHSALSFLLGTFAPLAIVTWLLFLH
jgi:hypothetical protein